MKIVKNLEIYGGADYISGLSTDYVLYSDYSVLYESSKYDGTVSVYLEAFIYSQNAGGTAYLQLCKKDGTDVAGVTLSCSDDYGTAVQQISGDISSSLADDTEYSFKLKTSTGAHAYFCKSVFLTVKQNGNISKTLTLVPLDSGSGTQTSTSYTITALRSNYGYDSSKWDGTTNIYLDVIGKSIDSSTTAYFELYNLTDSASVASSELSDSSGNVVRLRSGALSLTTGKDYVVRVKKSGTGASISIYAARLIITQDSKFTKSETYFPLDSYRAVSGTLIYRYNGMFWYDSDWDVVSKNVYLEATSVAGADSTLKLHAYDGTSNDVTITNSTPTTSRRIRSDAFTPDNNDFYRLAVQNDPHSGTSYNRIVWIVVQTIIQEATSTSSSSSSSTSISTSSTSSSTSLSTSSTSSSTSSSVSTSSTSTSQTGTTTSSSTSSTSISTSMSTSSTSISTSASTSSTSSSTTCTYPPMTGKPTGFIYLKR